MPTWDAELYLRFANERTRPASDLANRINLTNPARLVDLGCGPGNSTAILRNLWPCAEIVGVDNSPEMIAAATAAYPAGCWVMANIADWTSEQPFDLVFSNAALHWLPDHTTLFPRLLALVAPGGALAVQMPDVTTSWLHNLLAEVADRPIWRDRLTAVKSLLWNGQPGFYYDLLQPSAAMLDLWTTEYVHIMSSPLDILSWTRATALRPYLQALVDDVERAEFERLLMEGLTTAYPPQANGRVLFPYRRLFLIAYRGGE